MGLKRNDSFPWSLEQAAKEGFGAAAWTKEDGSRVWVERSEAGFEAAAFWGGNLALGATWKWVGEPGRSACALSGTSGPQGDAMEAARLSPAESQERVMEIMGAMAMGRGTFASADWNEWKAVGEAGLGFAGQKDGAWERLSKTIAAPDVDRAGGVAARRGPHGR